MFSWSNIQENISTNTVGISAVLSLQFGIFENLYGYLRLLLLNNMKRMYYVLEEEKTVENL